MTEDLNKAFNREKKFDTVNANHFGKKQFKVKTFI